MSPTGRQLLWTGGHSQTTCVRTPATDHHYHNNTHPSPSAGKAWKTNKINGITKQKLQTVWSVDLFIHIPMWLLVPRLSIRPGVIWWPWHGNPLLYIIHYLSRVGVAVSLFTISQSNNQCNFAEHIYVAENTIQLFRPENMDKLQGKQKNSTR